MSNYARALCMLLFSGTLADTVSAVFAVTGNKVFLVIGTVSRLAGAGPVGHAVAAAFANVMSHGSEGKDGFRVGGGFCLVKAGPVFVFCCHENHYHALATHRS